MRHLRWLDRRLDFLPAAPAAKPMSNVLLCSPLDHTGEAERGILSSGQYRISIHFAQACALERSLNCLSSQCQKQHGRQQLRVISPYQQRRIGRYGLPPTARGTIVVPLVSYHSPQAGQPPASKVLTRHSLPASLGAWS